MRTTVLMISGIVTAGLLTAGPAAADPLPVPVPLPGPASAVCQDAFCTPGITPNVVLGTPCDNTSTYVFGTAVAGASIQAGRLVFCGSPRRYAPRWFRAMPMDGIKEFGTNCSGRQDHMAQAPDGLFLTCALQDGQAVWVRGDA